MKRNYLEHITLNLKLSKAASPAIIFNFPVYCGLNELNIKYQLSLMARATEASTRNAVDRADIVKLDDAVAS